MHKDMVIKIFLATSSERTEITGKELISVNTNMSSYF